MEPKKLTQQTLTGQLGVNLIEAVVLRMGSIWNPTNIDVGIDGSIELCQPGTGSALGRVLYVQSRATERSFQGETDSSLGVRDLASGPLLDRSIRHLRGSLADHDLVGHEVLAAGAGPGSRYAKRSPAAQPRGQLAAQCPTALDEQSLVDRLVRDAHRLIIRKVDRQPLRDLFRAPRLRAAAVLPTSVPTADPSNMRAGYSLSVRRRDHPTKAILHVPPQRFVPRKLRSLGAPRSSVRMPLRRAASLAEALVDADAS